MTVDEIKLRQLTNQHLLAPSDPLTVAQDLCGIQAQFMTNVFHSFKIRCKDQDGTDHGPLQGTGKHLPCGGLVKNWTIRGTVHVFAERDLPLFLSCGEHYRRNEWTAPSFWNQRADWALTPQRQAYLSDIVLDALAAGPRTREELKLACREAGMTQAEEGCMFHPWGGGMRELCQRGFLHYAAQEEKVFCLSPACEPLPREEAELELARRYFTHLAPATVHDAQYFFHATAAQVKRWLSRLPVRNVECGGRTYFYIENGVDDSQSIPRLLFLAGFDQLMLGYEKKESLYLAPEFLRAVFNLGGIVAPTLLLDGKVVGTWKRKNGKLAIAPFSAVGSRDSAAIREAAEALWGEGIQVRFLQ